VNRINRGILGLLGLWNKMKGEKRMQLAKAAASYREFNPEPTQPFSIFSFLLASD
jgi:hypothetical protein